MSAGTVPPIARDGNGGTVPLQNVNVSGIRSQESGENIRIRYLFLSDNNPDK